jgi:hypothetical protein
MNEHDHHTHEIADAVRTWATDLADSLPPYRPDPDALGSRSARSERRSRWLVAGLAASVVAVGLAGLVWIRSRSPGDAGTSTSLAPPPTVDAVPVSVTPIAPPPTVDSTPVSATQTSNSGVEVSIDLPAQALVGTRVSVHVSVHNNGTETVYWQAGGCGMPAGVTIGPAGVDDDSYPIGAPRLSSEQVWDGSAATLTVAIDTAAAALGDQMAVPDWATGFTEFACPANSEMKALEPGGQLQYRGTVEVRVGPGPLPADGRFEAAATFVGYASPDGYPQTPLAQVTPKVEFEVLDHPARAAPSSAIAEAAAADGRLSAWHTTMLIPGRPDLDQRFLLAATWWRDAWEIWARPYWGSSDALRLRIDPATMTVDDARVVHAGGPPADEPRTSTLPGMAADELLPAPDGSGATTAAGATAEPSVVRAGEIITVNAPGEVCDELALIHELTEDGTRERGVLLRANDGTVTWNTPPENSPVTIPPCQPTAQSSPATFVVPELPPGSYMICLTRESDACAPFEVVA